MKRMPGQRDLERRRVYKELFPDRMIKDYIRLEKVESPLLELIPELNKLRASSDGIQIGLCLVVGAWKDKTGAC